MVSMHTAMGCMVRSAGRGLAAAKARLCLFFDMYPNQNDLTNDPAHSGKALV